MVGGFGFVGFVDAVVLLVADGFVGFASGRWSLSLWVLLGQWSSIFFFCLFYYFLFFNFLLLLEIREREKRRPKRGVRERTECI